MPEMTIGEAIEYAEKMLIPWFREGLSSKEGDLEALEVLIETAKNYLHTEID